MFPATYTNRSTREEGKGHKEMKRGKRDRGKIGK
jgi:hypothetical protein